MGKRNCPPLTPGEVIAILERLGFTKKYQQGSHAQYECPAGNGRERGVVTVDVGKKDFGDFLIKNIDWPVESQP